MTFPCLGPDPNPVVPAFEMPAGATDCHAHVIGVPPVYPFVEARSYTLPEASLQSFQEMHRRLGIERAVIVTPSVHGTDNRITLEAIQGYGAAARGIAVVDPGISDADLRTLDAGGIRGIRLNVLFGGGVGLHALKPLADRIRDLGWHIQLLINIGEALVDLEEQIRALGLPVVVDHMGYLPVEEGPDHPAFQALLRLVRDGYAWVKLSGNYRISSAHPAYRDAIPMARALIKADPTRMVWGTDWPHVALTSNMPNTGTLLNALADYAPDAALRKAILVDNPARLYGFERQTPPA
jgi:predicted TIM-barrel fold metal-dependent hydrolase